MRGSYTHQGSRTLVYQADSTRRTLVPCLSTQERQSCTGWSSTPRPPPSTRRPLRIRHRRGPKRTRSPSRTDRTDLCCRQRERTRSNTPWAHRSPRRRNLARMDHRWEDRSPAETAERSHAPPDRSTRRMDPGKGACIPQTSKWCLFHMCLIGWLGRSRPPRADNLTLRELAQRRARSTPGCQKHRTHSGPYSYRASTSCRRGMYRSKSHIPAEGRYDPSKSPSDRASC